MIWTLLWLTGRLAGSVGASVLQKRLLGAGVGIGHLWMLTYGVIAVPATGLLLAIPMPADPAFWHHALTAAALDVAGNLAMAVSLRQSDLSVHGPLNAFRPAIAGLIGWLFLGEVPSATGLGGMAILTLGALLLLDPGAAAGRHQLHKSLAGGAWRLGGITLSILGASSLKRALECGSAAWTLGIWVLAGGAALAIVRLLQLRATRGPWSPGPAGSGPPVAVHAGVFLVMQWCTLEIFQRTLLAYSFAWFQLGMVAQVLLGHWLFHEPQVRRRLAACVILSAGALLILISG